nr:uncharacterized protein LOC105345475 [Crassostrea gigas]
MGQQQDQSRVMESLSGIPTPGTEKPQQGNQCLLKLMSPPELLHSLTLTGVRRRDHISCATSDRVWVSDRNNLILTDTTGVPLHRVEDSCSDLFIGLHTVNSEGHPSGSRLQPGGICTDALSHILVCDGRTDTMSTDPALMMRSCLAQHQP